MSRTINDIPARQVAYYEWQSVLAAPTKLKDGDVCCVSVLSATTPRQIAEWRRGFFRELNGVAVIQGVTYFAYCPTTPEDFDKEQAKAARTKPSAEANVGSTAGASELELKGLLG